MANRHKKGGRVAYSGGSSNVAKEAEEHKKGGKVKDAKAHGDKSGKRLDKRARGGGVGKDMTKSPFSSAHIKTSGDAGK